MSILGVVLLVAAILLAWLMGAILVALAVGRVLQATRPHPPRPARGAFDRAA